MIHLNFLNHDTVSDSWYKLSSFHFRFAHCINLEYYQDLVNVLDHLLVKEPLNIREQLYCIKTVFIILSGQEDIINIDPLYFYSHLYRVMLDIHAGD